MAPRKSKKTVDNIIQVDDIDLLAFIGSETARVGYVYCDKSGIEPLIAAELVEVNSSNIDNRGYVQSRITDKGNEYLKNNKQIDIEKKGTTVAKKKKVEGEAAAPVAAFAISSFNLNAVVAKESKRRGRTSSYPFAILENGQGFFVAASEKHPEPEISLVSTVSAANKRFAVATGETRETKRKARGSEEVITKQVPVTRQEREFKVYPYIENGVRGAYVARVI